MSGTQDADAVFIHRPHRLTNEILWVGLGQGMVALGGVVGVRLLTHALEPAPYGELALAMTAASLTQQVLLGPLSVASSRFFAPALEADRLMAYWHAARSLLTKGSVLLIGVAGVVGIALWASGHADSLALTLAVATFSLVSGHASALDGIQTAARQRAVVAWHQGFSQWLRPIAAVTLISALQSTSSVAMLGYTVGSLVVLVSQLRFFQRRVLNSARGGTDPQETARWANHIREYAWPFVAWGTFTWAQISSDRWSLQAFGTTEQVGQYAVLYQVGYYPFTLFSATMMQLVSPILFSRAGDGTDEGRMAQARRLTCHFILGTMVVALFATGVAFLLHGWLFSWLVAPQYRDASVFLPWLVLSSCVFSVGQTASLLIMSGPTTRRLVAPKVGTAMAGVLLNAFGAYKWGVGGVVFASLAFSLIYLGWMLCLTSLTPFRLRSPATGS